VKDVDRGDDIVVEPHGKAIAALVDMRHLDEQGRLEADLRETAFICRAAPDTGHRAELVADFTAGRV
jgi:hypothetical protein